MRFAFVILWNDVLVSLKLYLSIFTEKEDKTMSTSQHITICNTRRNGKSIVRVNYHSCLALSPCTMTSGVTRRYKFENNYVQASTFWPDIAYM